MGLVSIATVGEENPQEATAGRAVATGSRAAGQGTRRRQILTTGTPRRPEGKRSRAAGAGGQTAAPRGGRILALRQALGFGGMGETSQSKGGRVAGFQTPGRGGSGRVRRQLTWELF